MLPVLLLLLGNPLSSLASPKAIQSDLKRLVPLFAEYGLYFGSLTLASTLICGNWAWVSHLFNQLELSRWGSGELTGFGFQTDFIMRRAGHDAPQLR